MGHTYIIIYYTLILLIFLDGKKKSGPTKNGQLGGSLLIL